LALTTRDYFVTWANAPEVERLFSADLTAMARAARRDEPLYLSVEYYDLHQGVWNALTWGAALPRPTWFDGRRALVLPRPSSAPARYFFSISAPPHAQAMRWLTPASDQDAVQSYRAASSWAPQHVAAINFDDVVRVEGYDLAGELRPGQVVDLALYWRVLRPLPSRYDLSYSFFVHLVDDTGYRWAQDDGIGYLSTEWQAGDQVITWFRLAVPADAPPKPYHLDIGLYRPDGARLTVREASGALRGTVARLASFRLDDVAAPSSATAEEGSLSILRHELTPARPRAGDTVLLVLYWQSQGRVSRDYRALVWWSDARGQTWGGQELALVQGEYPTSGWPPGRTVRDLYRLRMPVEMPAGTYTLHVARFDPATGTSTSVLTQPGVVIEASERVFAVPPMSRPLERNFADKIDLLGFDLASDRAQPGDVVRVTLYWRARQTLETNYTVFTHLVGPDAQIWGQWDSQPVGGTRPTRDWIPGEIIVDRYIIPIKPNAPPGAYRLEIGWYEAQTLERLPLFDETGQILDNRLLLAFVQVE